MENDRLGTAVVGTGYVRLGTAELPEAYAAQHAAGRIVPSVDSAHELTSRGRSTRDAHSDGTGSRDPLFFQRMSDQTYWDRFYEQPHPDLVEPSSFARLCVSLLSRDDSVFEVGCGNGRDALYMARSGLRVLASDPSHMALAEVRSRMQREPLPHPPRLVARPMENLDDRHAGDLDAVYMRFVLHAVTTEVASAGLRWASRNLRADGRLFVEARSVRGSLYGQGRPAGRDAFIQDGHYRRFIRLDELRDEIVDIGFRVDELAEADGLAVHGRDDPVVIRAFATRARALQS